MRRIVMIVMICVLKMNILNGQTAEIIIYNYIENIGGYNNLRKVEGVKIIKDVPKASYIDSIEVIRLKNGKQLITYVVKGEQNIESAFDGNVAWRHYSSQRKPKLQSDDETEIIRLKKLDFLNPFIDYKEKGFKITLLGKETINETLCFVLQLTKLPLYINGQVEDNIEFYYFDTKTYLPILIVREEKVGLARGKLVKEYVSDYKKVEDLFFPFRVERKYKNSAIQSVEIIKSIELNPKVEDSLFISPN